MVETRNIGRRAVMRGAAGLAAAAALGPRRAALAEDAWPTRPVRFIVPLAPGGGLDFVARAAGEYLSRSLGQQMVIENRTGAGGTIGTDAAMKSPPDGYTVLVTNDNVASAPHVMRLSVDYAKELVPVGLLSRQPLVLAVHPSLNVTTLPDLIALLKKSDAMGYATSGVGSNQHVLGAAFIRATGVRLDHVPYRGAGQAVNDVLAGHVKVAMLGPTALIAHHQAGNVRILAQSSPTRAPYLPDVPTFPELGFKDLDLESWYGVFVPLGTPQPIVTRLNTEIGKAMAQPTILENLFKGAQHADPGTPEVFGKLVRDYSDRYAKLVQELDIRMN